MSNIRKYMFMSEFVKPLNFAIKAHDGQYRVGTKIPYVVHPIRVAELVSCFTSNVEILQAALFHDIFEDVGVCDLSEGCAEGTVEYTTQIVNQLTKTKKISTEEYYNNIDDGFSILIKIADRYDNITDVDNRKKKYRYKKSQIESTDIILKIAEKRWSGTFLYANLFNENKKNKEFLKVGA